jgi:hypothetical protein
MTTPTPERDRWDDEAERLLPCDSDAHDVNCCPRCDFSSDVAAALRSTATTARQEALTAFADYHSREETMADAMDYREAAKFHEAVRKSVAEYLLNPSTEGTNNERDADNYNEAAAADRLAAMIAHLFAGYDIPDLPEKETEIAAILALGLSSTQIRAKLAALRSAAEFFQSGGDWGKWKAWLVNGPEHRAYGIDAARAITKAQAALDAALADQPATQAPTKKLVYDKQSRRIEAVPLDDPRAGVDLEEPTGPF